MAAPKLKPVVSDVKFKDGDDDDGSDTLIVVRIIISPGVNGYVVATKFEKGDDEVMVFYNTEEGFTEMTAYLRDCLEIGE